jgi:hypothetical protein
MSRITKDQKKEIEDKFTPSMLQFITIDAWGGIELRIDICPPISELIETLIIIKDIRGEKGYSYSYDNGYYGSVENIRFEF